jgi:hypothetical protein
VREGASAGRIAARKLAGSSRSPFHAETTAWSAQNRRCGIFAEVIRTELSGRKTEPVAVCDWTSERYELDERNPERPGRYFFAPLAASITAATRLLLAICERLVTDAGGTWALMDTDSCAVVSTEHGGLVPCPGGPDRDEHGRECVRALSWAQVDELRERTRALNPYRGKAGEKSILELEDENYDRQTGERRQLYCLALRSKGYCLYNLDERGEPELRAATEPDRHAEEEARAPVIRKRSDHGLGYLINPLDPDSADRDWILQGWEWIARSALGLDAPEPAWFEKPALMRYAVTTPGLLRCFKRWNADKPPRRQVRPFNFFMVAQEKQLARDKAGELQISPITGQCALIAPYESDPGRWEKLEWTNRYQPGSSYRITTDPGKLGMAANLLAARTLRDVFAAYRDSPEPKSLGPDGNPGHPQTVGLLSRRHVRPASIASIGKEMNALEEQLAGIRQTEPERGNTYRRPGEDPLWNLVIKVLQLPELPVKQAATGARVSTDTVERVRAGTLTGKTARAIEARAKLTRYAIRHASAHLRTDGLVDNPRKISPPALLATYLDHIKRGRREHPCARAGCEHPARPTGAYCSDRCARAAWQTAYRKRKQAAA